MIRCLFRQPRFPIICDVNGVLLGAETPQQFVEQVCSIDLPADGYLPLVDASGAGWALETNHLVVSPLTGKRRWTKKEVIALFNNSDTAKRSGKKYSMKSLSSKRFDRILSEIVALIRT